MLNVLLVGIAPIDCVQIFCLHGLVPQLAGSLMPICEVFGSCVPNISWTLTTGEEISAHAVFSNASALFLKLWRFNHPPLEYGVGDVPPMGSQLTHESPQFHYYLIPSLVFIPYLPCLTCNPTGCICSIFRECTRRAILQVVTDGTPQRSMVIQQVKQILVTMVA